jgi:hypothetical protein
MRRLANIPTTVRQALLTLAFGGIILLVGALIDSAHLALAAVGLVALSAVVGGLAGALVAGVAVAGHLAPHIPGSTPIDPERFRALIDAQLVEDSHLQEIEASIDVPEIWVITAEPAIEVGGAGFIEVITRRISDDRVTYVYIIPDSIGAGAENALRAELPDHGVSVLRLSQMHWQELPLSNGMIVIYNPRSVRQKAGHGGSKYHKCVAYFEYPTGGKRCWGRVDSQQSVEWADVVARIAEPRPVVSRMESALD